MNFEVIFTTKSKANKLTEQVEELLKKRTKKGLITKPAQKKNKYDQGIIF
jgi:hypothetical protein